MVSAELSGSLPGWPFIRRLVLPYHGAFGVGAVLGFWLRAARVDIYKVVVVTLPLFFAAAYVGSQQFQPQNPDAYALKAYVAPPLVFGLLALNLVFLSARVLDAMKRRRTRVMAQAVVGDVSEEEGTHMAGGIPE